MRTSDFRHQTSNFALLLLVYYCAVAAADISGTITDNMGNAVPDARVFVEPGIECAVIEGTVAGGVFAVHGNFYGNAGVFAFAPGYGYGGVHLNIAAGDVYDNVAIVLTPETSVSGTVADARGAPVAGARIASIAVTHPVKVGIPLSKLTAFGVVPPESDASGRFRVGAVPQDAVVALKFEHHKYAQEAVTDVAAGAADLKVVMHRGVTTRGQVLIHGSNTPGTVPSSLETVPVSGAVVMARNAQPPHDTAFSATDGSGVFTLRLKPGVYLFQAHAAGRVSPGLQRLEISGELPEQNMRLMLSETSTITGTMHDAKTGDPIPGVRVLLETQGQPAGAARTGPDGRFLLQAAAGDNVLLFESAHGYLPPDTRALRVNAPGGDTLELPGFWLAPIPKSQHEHCPQPRTESSEYDN